MKFAPWQRQHYSRSKMSLGSVRSEGTAMSYPTFDEIRRLRDAEMVSYAHGAKSGRDPRPGYASLAAGAGRPLLPLYRDVLCDLETPVSAYCKTAKGPYSFLLESVTGGEHA